MADGTATAEFTFFNKAGQKVTGHDCEDVVRNFKPTPERPNPSEITSIVGKRHIFQIQFATNSQKGAARFTVNDVLDIPEVTTTKNDTGATTSVDVVRNDEPESVPLTQETEEGNEAAYNLDTPDVQNTPTDTQDQTNVVPSTPPHDVIETVAATIISTIPNPKVAQQKANATSSKRSLDTILSVEAKKKKDD